MIDINKGKKLFDKFVSNYDMNNNLIRCKYDHTLRVVELCQKIGESLSLDKDELEMAALLGLLHDMGRFEQVRLTHDFNEKIVNHADLTIKILFEEGLIKDFIDTREYDNLIRECVHFHNTHKIDDNCDPKVKKFSKILRDADKVDIYKVLIDADYFDFNITDKPKDDILNCVFNNESIDWKQVINNSDARTVPCGYIFDLHYCYSFTTIKDNDYYNKYLDKLIITDPSIKEIFERIRVLGNEYINKKIESKHN